ncbi:substrate-binding domain-containing protein [Streptomyces lomondensis]|uniref:Sugar ABC transporter substrate-binding protein n=1 Tax=Streptomyces lomondensis TaxID=68229 RepID=A0ABQ2XIV3_9ACTN|nr:substrate-binding domain-containing protein [Streptomyces lomondensis]MCF0079581.1 substrate-binding domain-containing protein [Streptomyces lomondensis]GGX19012.1 sugar ABC transporter substrate-binding protein [Streptomyces lomondensis]
MPYHRTRKQTVRAVAALAVLAASLTGCVRGSQMATPGTAGSGKAGCPGVLAKAKKAVGDAEAVDVPWRGPTTGPRAVSGPRTLVYVANTMTNPGIAGAAEGVREAARTMGWKVRVIDGQGSPAGVQKAFSQAIALNPSGIVIGGFDPKTTSEQVRQANAKNIPLIGWHAVNNPGPSTNPKLYTNVTTDVGDVAKISADWVIAQSNGTAGVVVFTDASIPFADMKAKLIEKELATCPDVHLLATENIPIPDSSSRTPTEVSSLLARYRTKWTYSVAINDLYFGDAAPALRSGGKQGGGAPFNIGAGDGDSSAFQRINTRQFQAATVPEPLNEQGWQIVDEFNRAFAGKPASGYVSPPHIATARNSAGASSWDPKGYREAYRKLWGK